MRKTIIYLCLLSLVIIGISIERYSATTRIFLQPYNFLRLHEFVQITLFTLASIVLSFLIFKHVSSNLELTKSKKGMLLTILFFLGMYLYVTGNTIHEISSFFLNTYCPLPGSPLNLCAGLFFNDYYFGNALYFIGVIFSNIPIIVFEIQRPAKKLTDKENYFIIATSVIYALGLFAYAAFDKVIVGMLFVLTAAIITNVLLFTSKKPMKTLPFTSYCALAYSLATIAALTIKYH